MPVTDFIEDHITIMLHCSDFFTNNAGNQIFANRECSFGNRKVKIVTPGPLYSALPHTSWMGKLTPSMLIT